MSQVSLKEQLKNVGIDVSEHAASYRGPPPAYTSPRVMKRGDVDKYYSEVPMKDRSGSEVPAKDVYVSQSQLPPPSVVFKKETLPVRTKSNVPLGKGKSSFTSHNQKEYKKYKTPKPNKQFMWERTKSSLPLPGKDPVPMPQTTNKATYRPHKVKPLPPMDPKTKRLALIESKGTQWDLDEDEEDEDDEGGEKDVPSLKASPLSSPNASPRHSPTTVLGHGRPTGTPHSPFLRGSTNKCHSTVQLHETPRPDGFEPNYFVTTHKTAFTQPPGYDAHSEFQRTKSAWVPGIDGADYKTTHVDEYPGGKDWNRNTGKYQWARTRSTVPMVPAPPPSAPSGSVRDDRMAEYRDAFKLGLESSRDWTQPVLRGTVNKYSSLVELPHKGSGEGSLHYDTTHGHFYSAEALKTPRAGARFFDRTASRVPLDMPGAGGRPVGGRDTTYATSYSRDHTGASRPQRVLPLKTPCTVRLL